MSRREANKIRYCNMKTPIGNLLLTGTEEGLLSISFVVNQPEEVPEEWVEEEQFFEEAIRQLNEYFGGTRKEFNLKLHPEGTPFQLEVWQEMSKIPYGETLSYGELASRIDRPKASRAIGGACNKNRLPVVIPCHRVIGKTGKLVGFGGGLTVKEKLLKLEQGDLT